MKVITECTIEDTILINEPVMENFEDGNYEIIESIITNIHSCLGVCMWGGNLSKKLVEYGYDVKSTDLFNHGYGESNIDFLKQEEPFDGDIITNPPYSYSLEFVLKALELSKQKVAMLFNIRFLESIRRYENLFKVFPPAKVYVFVRRIHCYPNGEEVKKGGSSVCYAWFIFDKEYDGEPIIRWINNKE